MKDIYTLENKMYALSRDRKLYEYSPGEEIMLRPYLPFAIKEILNSCRNKHYQNLYLVCPFNKKFQVGVTGKYKHKENRFDALYREIREETALDCLEPDFIRTNLGKTEWYSGVFTKFNFASKLIPETNRPDNYAKHISACVWSDLDTLISHPSMDKIASPEITHLGFMSYYDVMNILDQS